MYQEEWLVHRLREDMLLSLLASDPDYNDSDYEEDSDYDWEEDQWDYEYESFSEFGNVYESDEEAVQPESTPRP